MSRWRRVALGLYIYDAGLAKGVVFVSPKPLHIWAWSVYNFSTATYEAGMEYGFRDARHHAQEAIQRVCKRA